MNASVLGWLAIDLVCVALLAFAVYFPRHRRRDLALAFVALNVGVFAVVYLLSMLDEQGLALGLGLFGVLSIIRLRSASMQHEEVGYYFVTLVLGLVNGLGAVVPFAAGVLDVVLLGALFAADHPRLLRNSRQTTVTLDMVHSTPEALRADLERRLGGEVVRYVVTSVDYVQDITVVDARYRSVPRHVVAGVR